MSNEVKLVYPEPVYPESFEGPKGHLPHEINMAPVEKCIRVTDEVVIVDLTVTDTRKNFYFLLADIPDKENSVILKFSPGLDEEEPQERAKHHVATIIGIPGKKSVLHNIRLVNYTAQEAEDRGLLHPPGYIVHIPVG